MSDDHSDGEGDGGHKTNPVDRTEDMEIELNLPREVDGEQDRPVRTSVMNWGKVGLGDRLD